MKRVISMILAFSFCLCLCLTCVVSASADTVTTYTKTITIYDITGSQSLETYALSDDAPITFNVFVSATGCTISSDAGTYVYLFSGSDFAGFAVTPNGGVVYGIGGSFVGDADVSLYVVQEAADTEYQGGVLGWLENLWNGITSLPSNIWNWLKSGFDSVVAAISGLPQAIADALSFFDVKALFDNFDFTPVTDFFTTAWENIKSGFGLKDYLEGPDSPFGWFTGESTVSDDNNFVSGILNVLSIFGVIGTAIPLEVISVLCYIFCGVVIIAILKVF